MRSVEDGLAVLRLALDTSDPVQRRYAEAMFESAYQLRRAVLRDARARVHAYWAASKERARDPAALRERLGLSRDGLEDAAFAHLDAAPHLRRWVTKALAQHIADSVWTAIARHLFADARGKRQGLARVGRRHDHTRLPGRSRSHRTSRKWETFRLHGSLAGHRAAYAARDGRFVQPRRLRQVQSSAWWDYTGPLAVVFTGLGGGTVVLPVRLPTAPCNQAILDHYLANPSRWHKIDLVRRRDPNAAGGWRYEAHLMVLTQPYASPRTVARRATAALAGLDRVAGIDVNVSNITIASHVLGAAIELTRIERDATQRRRDRGRARRERRRQRALDRSRRAMNREQYRLSRRQEKRARRREAQGLRAVDVVPMGPRVATAAGVPVQRYRRDQLSTSYRRMRGAQVADAAAATQARADRARQTAAEVIAAHGCRFIVEDTSIAAWSRSWGRQLAAFSPGLLVAAIDREARAVAAIAGGTGGVTRASTRTTALSQHCPCGARVEKPLAERAHRCRACGLVGDRDAVSAVLASFVTLSRPGEPAAACVDYTATIAALPELRHALLPSSKGWQDTPSESTDLCAREGSFLTWRTSTPDAVVVARRIVGMAPCSTLNESGASRATSDRAWMRTNTFRRYGPSWTYLRDKS